MCIPHVLGPVIKQLFSSISYSLYLLPTPTSTFLDFFHSASLVSSLLFSDVYPLFPAPLLKALVSLYPEVKQIKERYSEATTVSLKKVCKTGM